MDDSDLADVLAGFAQALREVGVQANTARAIASVDALTVFPAAAIGQLYWSTRLSFCARRADIPLFDAVFHAWFGIPQADNDMRRSETDETAKVTQADPADGAASGESIAGVVTAGSAESMWTKDIRELSADERDEINRLIARLALRPPMRPTLRCAPGGRYREDVDQTVRSAFHHAGEPVRLYYRRRTAEPQRLLLLLDVSGSMTEYSDAFLRFGHAALHAPGTAVEVFTLGTRFVRVTTALLERDPDQAMRAVSAADPTRGGGTRLGPALGGFLQQWSGHRAVRSATVVIASDGWESGRVDVLEQQVRRLKLLSRRLIWVNPRAGAPSFKPFASGLRRVLPLVDDHVSGHSFAALQSLADLMAGAV